MDGTVTNQTGETLLVYGPAHSGETHDNSLYYLPTGRATPGGWDCDGIYVPNDRYASQAILPERRGPVAVKYVDPQFPTITRTNDRYHCPFNYSILAPGEVNWEIPNVAYSSVPGSYPVVPGHVVARPVRLRFFAGNRRFVFNSDGLSAAILEVATNGPLLPRYVVIDSQDDVNSRHFTSGLGGAIATFSGCTATLEALLKSSTAEDEFLLTCDFTLGENSRHDWQLSPADFPMGLWDLKAKKKAGDGLTPVIFGIADWDEVPYVEDLLNSEERRLLSEDPVAGARVLLAARAARDAAFELYAPASLHNGNGDAFRHAYWNALMKRSVGLSWANRWSNAHEEIPGNPVLEKAMDQFNNEQGRGVEAASDDEARQKVQTLTRGGGLRRIENGLLVPTDSGGERS